MAKTEGIYSTDRLGEIWPPAGQFADIASGVLVISVSPEPSDYIIWFRPEIISSVQWAGPLTKVVEPGPNGDRLTPRKSFEAWKETVLGRSTPWTPADADAAFDLRISLLHVVLKRINAAAFERKRAAERDKLLMAELDHRVKNTLANIQALVIQTSRSAESLTGFVEGLDGRLQSMAKAHSLLSQSRWEGVSIDKLMREELDQYGRSDHAIGLRGPEVALTPKSALSLSLAVHELATNATKFGALSVAGGHVSVEWLITSTGGIRLTWHERGGPVVAAPKRRGFGSTLIERALAMETGGRADLQYLVDGVTCVIFLPATSIAAANQAVLVDTVVSGETFTPIVPRAPYRILVVEDAFLVGMMLEDLFQDLGWTIVGPAARLDVALLLANTETLDAALLDVNLDGEMSWPVADALKRRGVPFAFSTGYDVNAILPAHLVGTPVIAKPFLAKNARDILLKLLKTESPIAV